MIRDISFIIIFFKVNFYCTVNKNTIYNNIINAQFFEEHNFKLQFNVKKWQNFRK